MEKALNVIKELLKAKVKFVVIGGVASSYYGVKRATFDLDLLMLPKDKDLRKIISVLKKLGYKSIHSLNTAGNISDNIGSIIKISLTKIKKYHAVRFINSFDVDLMFPENSAFFDFVWEYRFEIALGGLKIPVPNLIDLIRIKELSGRNKDLEDAKVLRHILRRGISKGNNKCNITG